MESVIYKHIRMFDLLVCLTNAGDLVSPRLADHHKKVAYLAYRIGHEMGLPLNEQKELMLAGLLHDVGALSLNERLELIENETPSAHDHANKGAKLLERFEPLVPAAKIIQDHHTRWENGAGAHRQGREVSTLSHILHLADRIAVQVDPDRDVIGQIESIRNSILRQKGSAFYPDAVDAFESISYQEYIWLDTVYAHLMHILPNIVSFDVIELDLDGLIQLSQVIACIIDYRSPFTANHSAGVAKTAEKLAMLAGFSEREQKMMRVAGFLHDFGKLAVANEILEKTDRLTESEFNVIRSHTFYTYRLLQAIDGLQTINIWASFHHEKLNGQGYPFHLTGDSIPLGSRIMAVADIFTAITENRPYRKGMRADEVFSVLDKMVGSGFICPFVVSLLKSNMDMINEIRIAAQQSAACEYDYFMDVTSSAGLHAARPIANYSASPSLDL